MARDVNRLNGKKVPGMREPGLFADGAGLYLRIDQTGSRRWVYIFYRAGRRREMGLGAGEEQLWVQLVLWVDVVADRGCCHPRQAHGAERVVG